jgi:hypothetical protein
MVWAPVFFGKPTGRLVDHLFAVRQALMVKSLETRFSDVGETASSLEL